VSEQRPFTRRPRSADEFIQEAEMTGPAAGGDDGPLPWGRARADVTKPYQLRLPEKHDLMLKYIADHTPYSMHAFCLEVLLDAIENKALDIFKSNH
jgi:hypothetical protein